MGKSRFAEEFLSSGNIRFGERLSGRSEFDIAPFGSDERKQRCGLYDPIVEAATLLAFVRSERGDIELTSAGKAFAEADISARKELFREAALTHVTLLQQMNSSLASKSSHTMPLE